LLLPAAIRQIDDDGRASALSQAGEPLAKREELLARCLVLERVAEGLQRVEAAIGAAIVEIRGEELYGLRAGPWITPPRRARADPTWYTRTSSASS
jgi:hypothetical protein